MLIPSKLFLIQLVIPIDDQYLTQIGQRHHKNEHVKACVGSITATDYAKTLLDCIQFPFYITTGDQVMPSQLFLIQPATSMGKYLTQIGKRQVQYLSKLQQQSLHQNLIMPEPCRTTSIFVYISWKDKLMLSQLFLIQFLVTSMDQYLIQIGPRHHKNEHVKTCVGSIQQLIMPEPCRTAMPSHLFWYSWLPE